MNCENGELSGLETGEGRLWGMVFERGDYDTPLLVLVKSRGLGNDDDKLTYEIASAFWIFMHISHVVH